MSPSIFLALPALVSTSRAFANAVGYYTAKQTAGLGLGLAEWKQATRPSRILDRLQYSRRLYM